MSGLKTGALICGAGVSLLGATISSEATAQYAGEQVKGAVVPNQDRGFSTSPLVWYDKTNQKLVIDIQDRIQFVQMVRGALSVAERRHELGVDLIPADMRARLWQEVTYENVDRLVRDSDVTRLLELMTQELGLECRPESDPWKSMHSSLPDLEWRLP
ncbi:MAG: hypothetical protein KDD42_02025 [Bdellovibrionales bacterium]|nr:hypothetical protein [Bdellovibrionales bacterium]